MTTGRRVFVGVLVVLGALFGICVMMGGCGYRVHGSITDHGKTLVGFEHQAGYQGQGPRRHRRH
jgi:hypothetical protein